MNELDISIGWANAELLQGKAMIVIGVAFAIGTVLTLRHYDGLIRGFSGPAILIVLALCGYGTSLVVSRSQQAGEFAIAYGKDPVQFRVAEQKRLTDIKTSLSRNKIIWVVLLIAAAITVLFLSSPTFITLALGLVLASATALAIDTALAHRAESALQQFAMLQ